MTSHYLNQWGLVYLTHICVTRPQRVKYRLTPEIGLCLNIKTVFHGISIPIVKMRQLSDHLICIMEISILPRCHLYIQMATRCNLSIEPWRTNLSENWSSIFIALKMSSSKYQLFCLSLIMLTHWGRDKMASISQTTLSNAFCWIKMISLNFVPKGPINNIPALVQIMAWCRSGNKPLSEPMMVSLLMHICITWPQWVNKKCKYMPWKQCGIKLPHRGLVTPYCHIERSQHWLSSTKPLPEPILTH